MTAFSIEVSGIGYRKIVLCLAETNKQCTTELMKARL